MGEMEESVTIRMGTEDVRTMDDFMSENGFKSRSRFIRNAIIGYIDMQKHSAESAGNGVFVRFREVQMEAIRLMVEQGYAWDEEEYVRKCVLEKLVDRDSEIESAGNAFKTAQITSKMK